MTAAPVLSIAIPTPADVAPAVAKGCFARVHVSGAGCYASSRSDLDTARQVFDAFVDAFAAAVRDGKPLVAFPASGHRVAVLVAVNRVSAVEVVRVQAVTP